MAEKRSQSIRIRTREDQSAISRNLRLLDEPEMYGFYKALNNQSFLNLRGIVLIFSILSSALHIALATRNTQSTMAWVMYLPKWRWSEELAPKVTVVVHKYTLHTRW